MVVVGEVGGKRGAQGLVQGVRVGLLEVELFFQVVLVVMVEMGGEEVVVQVGLTV